MSKYAIKITNYWVGSNGSDSCSFYHREGKDSKVVLFDSEEDAEEFIASNSMFPPPDQADVVVYSELIINKQDLIDFIVIANDHLKTTVESFCKSIELYIEITYKYAIEVTEWQDGRINKRYLYCRNNEVYLFDDISKAQFAAGFFTTDDNEAEVITYQKIVKDGNNIIKYNLYD